MKIMVTGSSGTVGSALCEALLASHEVAPIDTRHNPWNEELDRQTVLADLRRTDEVATLPTDVDMIVHCAANARVYDLVVDPSRAFDNIQTTFNMLEFARQNHISRFIFASSREVYSTLPRVEYVAEDMVDIIRCESPYTASKIAGEALVYSYGKVYDINHVVFRFSNVYGRYDDSNRVIPNWINNAFKGEPLILYGPHKLLDFTYLDDAIAGISSSIERFDVVHGNTVNLSYGKAERLSAVAQMILELTDSSSEIVNKNIRPGELWSYQADLSVAKRLLKYVPVVGIEEGLRRSVEWYKSRV